VGHRELTSAKADAVEVVVVTRTEEESTHGLQPRDRVPCRRNDSPPGNHLKHLVPDRPGGFTIADAVRVGFDDAANQVEAIAISAGRAARPDHLVKALSIVEELRSIAVGNRDKPKHGV
jgi:hypothetical protein